MSPVMSTPHYFTRHVCISVCGAPGTHPGDVRKLKVAATDALRTMIRGADRGRMNAVFFSVLGERSEQDKIAGGDSDGDKRSIIAFQPLVSLVPNDEYAAYDADAMRRRHESQYGAAASHTRGKGNASAAQARSAPPAAAHGAGSNHAANIERRLVANYLMARFNSSPLVTRCGIEWQAAAEWHGADHPKALMIDHLSKLGLDEPPPDYADGGISTRYLPPLPAELRSAALPEYVRAKQQKKARRRVGTAASKPAVRTTASLKSMLYNAQLITAQATGLLGPNPLFTVRRDRHLSSCVWMHPDAPSFRIKWERTFGEYQERQKRLRDEFIGGDGEGCIPVDSPYWERYAELEAEMRERYLGTPEVPRYSPAERTGVGADQAALYAEAAAIYEACYKTDALGQPARVSASAVRFPFRIAAPQLVDMKRRYAAP
jgi:hypothetical protein